MIIRFIKWIKDLFKRSDITEEDRIRIQRDLYAEQLIERLRRDHDL